jgi:hypothetical protein
VVFLKIKAPWFFVEQMIALTETVKAGLKSLNRYIA